MLKTATSGRSSRRESRNQQLIDASIAVFSAKGVSATSVDDIVQAAGVAKNTFYLYVSTKDDAVNAVAERMVEGVADRIEVIAMDPHRSRSSTIWPCSVTRSCSTSGPGPASF
jgi:AcrR family transcriptional regulator